MNHRTFYILNTPFLRLLIPLLGGIIIQELFNCELIAYILIGCSFFLFTIHSSTTSITKQYKNRFLFGSGLAILIIAIGIIITKSKQDSVSIPKLNSGIYQVMLNDNPEKGKKSYRVTALIIQTIDSAGIATPVNRYAMLYFALDSTISQLKRNDYLYLYTKPEAIRNQENPNSFDYQRYLRSKSIVLSAYIASGNYRRIRTTDHFDLRSYALNIRDKMIKSIKTCGLKSEDYGLLIPLILGYTATLTDDQKADFASTGLSHILAVSGGHVIIIYWILSCLLFFLSNYRLKPLKIIIILIGVWAYAFLTGLAPSVVRSSVMFSMISVGLLVNRPNSALNSVFVAAFFMLLYDPFVILDIGFQLSFLAVISLILFQDPIQSRIKCKNPVLEYIVSIFSVTLAAQILTLPLCIYYFNQIPVFFLFTNLLVIPALPIVTIGGFLIIACDRIGISATFITMFTEWMINYIQWVVAFFSSFDLNSLKGIHLNAIQLSLIYLSIILFLFYIYTKTAKALILSLVFLIVGFGTELFNQIKLNNDKPANQLFIYNQRGVVGADIIQKDYHVFVSPDSSATMNSLKYAASGNWLEMGCDSPQLIYKHHTDTILSFRDNFLSYRNKRILFILDNRYKYKISKIRPHINYLILCKSFRGSIESLSELFIIDHVIIDTSLKQYVSQRIQQECEEKTLPCHNLSQHGAFRIVL